MNECLEFRISVLCMYICIRLYTLTKMDIRYYLWYDKSHYYGSLLIKWNWWSKWKSPGHWRRRAWRKTPLFMPQFFGTVATPQPKSRLRCCHFGGVALWHLGKAWSMTVECQPCICVPARRNHVYIYIHMMCLHKITLCLWASLFAMVAILLDFVDRQQEFDIQDWMELICNSTKTAWHEWFTV